MLTADFDERVGLKTFEKALLDQLAKDWTSLRSSAWFFDSLKYSAEVSVQEVVLSRMMRTERAKRTVTQAMCHET